MDHGSDAVMTVRMTPVPAVVLPEPEVRAVGYRDLTGGWLQMELLGERRQIPDGVCDFELHDVDLESSGACTDFAKEIEAEVVPIPARTRWSDLMHESYSVEHGLEVVDYEAEPDYADIVTSVGERLGFHLEPDQVLRGTVELRVHVAEIAVRVWMLRILTGVVRGDIGLVGQSSAIPDLSLHDSDDDTPDEGILPGVWPFGIYPSIPTTADVATIEEWFQRFLAPFSPRIDFGGGSSAGSATAIDVAALQLHSQLVDRGGWKTCQRCGRAYVRQRGRAKPDGGGWHRPDSLYCQKKCAQAAASANWRRKQRTKASD